jgi:hypothetical protein
MPSGINSRIPGLTATILWLLAMIAVPSARAEESGLKSGAREVGHATGSAVHEVGQIGKEIGQGAKKAGKTIGNAAREGGREFRRAVKGQR